MRLVIEDESPGLMMGALSTKEGSGPEGRGVGILGIFSTTSRSERSALGWELKGGVVVTGGVVDPKGGPQGGLKVAVVDTFEVTVVSGCSSERVGDGDGKRAGCSLFRARILSWIGLGKVQGVWSLASVLDGVGETEILPILPVESEGVVLSKTLLGKLMLGRPF